MTVCENQDWLDDAIASVIRSKESDWEMLLFVDGCDLSIPKPKDDRIRTVISADKLGRVQALRQSFSIASESPFICWVDSDDMLGDKALGATLSLLESEPGCMCAVTGLTEFSHTGDAWRIGARREPEPFVEGGAPLSPHLALVRRDAYLEVGGFDASREWAMDVDLLLRVEELGRVRSDPNPSHYFWRKHPQSYGSSDRKRQARHCDIAKRAALKRRGNKKT